MKPSAIIPGVKSCHAMISDTCRETRGDREAFETAARMLQNEYAGLIQFWKKGRGAKIHLVLTVEYPQDGES